MRWTQQQYNEWLAKKLASMGVVRGKQREHDTQPALGKEPPAQQRSTRGLAYRVQFISCRNRLLDGDNSISGGNKALRDAVSEWLGLDDGSDAIQFEYAQLHTSGEEGTIVRVERLDNPGASE